MPSSLVLTAAPRGQPPPAAWIRRPGRGVLSDEELVRQALSGVEDGFQGLVTRYQRPVYNLLAQMLRHPGLAEELAQETFLRAFSHLQSYDPRFRFINWILRIAHNLAIDALRRRAPLEVSLDEPVGPDAPARAARVADPHADTSREAERGQLARALDAALARLRPEYRRLVVLHYHEEMSYEDIAVITGLPLGTVKSYLHRARAEMAGHLTDAGWGRTGGLQPSAEAGRRTR